MSARCFFFLLICRNSLFPPPFFWMCPCMRGDQRPSLPFFLSPFSADSFPFSALRNSASLFFSLPGNVPFLRPLSVRLETCKIRVFARALLLKYQQGPVPFEYSGRPSFFFSKCAFLSFFFVGNSEDLRTFFPPLPHRGGGSY